MLSIRRPRQALESGLAEAFECLPERGLLSISATLPSGTDLADVWEAMELAGSADRHLGAIAGVPRAPACVPAVP
jgi:hypothetical protein